MKNFIDLFSGLQRAHGCTYVEKKNADGTKIKGKSFVKREPVTEKHWQDHLNGIEPSLGIIPIDENNKCRWGCIDVDKYNLDHKKIINLINNYQLPLTMCRSKSGGAHIFLFTTVPVDASLMRDKLCSISAFLGFGNAEVFPKQVELKSEDDTGNFLNLPYFNSKNTTRYAFNFKGEAITISQFFLAIKRLTPEELEKLELKRPDSEFKDGPPCIESLTQNKLNDGRDRVIYQYIQYAKRKWPEEWQKHINAFNYKYFDPPLEDRVIQDKIKYHEKKELGFKCNEEPMCNHCDKKLCLTRPFGIKGQSLFPDLNDLQKINLDEPYVEIKTLNQKNSFIIGKAKTFDEEKKVADKAPIEGIEIINISQNSNKSKKNSIKSKSNTSFKYIIKIADFYFENSAITLKNRLQNEYNILSIKVKKMSKNSYRVYKGPFYNLDSIKRDYSDIIKLKFENIEIIKL